MRARALFLALLISTGLIIFACGGNKKPPPKEPAVVETTSDAGSDAPAEAEPPAQKSLFERLGGKDGIAQIVDALIKRVSGDAKINKRFAALKGPKLDKFKAALADQICEESGGPDCKYGGKTMKDAHAKMKIKEEDWQAFLLDLKGALEDAKVGETEQGDLMSTLSKFHDDVVDPKTKPPPKK